MESQWRWRWRNIQRIVGNRAQVKEIKLGSEVRPVTGDNDIFVSRGSGGDRGESDWL